MSIIRESNIISETVLSIAKEMIIAARTAPKGKGKNTLEMFVVEGNEIIKLSDTLGRMGTDLNIEFYKRDAENLLHSTAIVIIGTEIKPLGLNEICQLCGFNNCSEKEQYPNTPCVFNTGDLSLAIGSAISKAADLRIDNRVMFSIGKAAIKSKLFTKNIKIAYGIPLSATSKNPFFDRPIQNK